MKKLMTILLMTATLSSAHALWSVPIKALRPIIKETPTILKELSTKKICGIIKTTGLAKRPVIEALLRDRPDRTQAGILFSPQMTYSCRYFYMHGQPVS